MRLLPVLIGLLILTIGSAIYLSIPNLHNTQTTLATDLAGPKQEVVPAGAVLWRPLNVTVDARGNPRLEVNVTVKPMSGEVLSQLDVRISNDANKNSCVIAQPPSNCMYEKTVSNSSIELPLNASGSYYFVLDNTPSSQEKLVSYAIGIKSEQAGAFATRDGFANWLGLSLGAVGSLTVIYGLSRKTIIPWE
jgi:hypothetical protein